MCPAISRISQCFGCLKRAVLLMAVFGFALSGCGSGEVRGRISGKVTFQGQPLSEGLVFFGNDDKGIHMSGDVKPDGTYEIITAKGAGLPLGTYHVRVRPPLEPLPTGVMRVAPKPKKYANIPEKYREFETSGLTLTVKDGDNPFDISMKP
jgi:hypothetical protein